MSWHSPHRPVRSSWSIERLLLCASPKKRTRTRSSWRQADDTPPGCIDLLAHDRGQRLHTIRHPASSRTVAE